MKNKEFDIRKVYEEMELDLIRSMRRNLTRHKKEELKQGFRFEQWQSAKLRDLERFRRENIKILGEYVPATELVIAKTLTDTYKKSRNEINTIIKQIKNKYIDGPLIKLPGDIKVILTPLESIKAEDMTREALKKIQAFHVAPTPLDDSFFRLNDKKLNSLIESTEKDFKQANRAVLRRMDDAYRQTLLKTQVHYNTGTVTLDKAIDMGTKDFLGKGVDAVTYRGGKKVNIASYGEMALRTANHRAYLMGEGKTRQELGSPLIVVSAHATACELCVPWQGLILIDDVYSGGKQEDGPYPLLSEAMKKGFLHPNCRHNLSTFFPGITTLPKVPDMEGVEENYKQEQRQRYIERQIKKFKRLELGALDEVNQKQYADKVLEWQSMMRKHLKDNPQLRRSSRREQIY